jgi:chemotaxis protein CheX
MSQLLDAGQQRVQIHLSVRPASANSRATGRASGETGSISRDGWREVLEKATCEVSEIMLGTSLGNASDGNPPVVAHLTATVGLGGSLCGVMALFASSKSARRMAARMLGSDEVDMRGDVQDALGEVCNMIAGSFKGKVAGPADGCALSVPTVVSRKDYALH